MKGSNGRILIGAVLILIGGLFLLENFGFPWFYDFNLRHLIFSWHSIFIIVGLVILVNHKDNFLGYILLGIGIFGVLRHFVPFLFNLDFGDLWPIILLLFGLWLILKRNNGTSIHHHNHKFENGTFASPPEGQTQNSTSAFDSIDEVCIFNSIKKVVTSQNFKGGKVTSIFGGIKLDLTGAKLSDGENVLEITCLFGGVDIRIPSDWKTVINVTSIFGGFDDKRFASYNTQTTNGVLVVKGSAIFGGGEILY